MNDIPLSKSAAAAVFMEEANYDVERAKAVARRRLADPQYAELREILWRDAIDSAIESEWREGRQVRKREALSPTQLVTGAMAPRRTERSGQGLSVARQDFVAPRPLSKGEMSVPNPAMQLARERHVAGLMAFEMPEGTRLFQWSKRKLIDHAQRVIANGKAAMHTGMFFLSVGEMLPKDDSLVGDVLTEADLQRLYRRQRAIPA